MAPRKVVIPRVVQLAVIALALSLIVGASTPTSPSSSPSPLPASAAQASRSALVSKLPPTDPGLGHDEGVFLVTPADDGSQAVYFIAGGARHSVLPADMQTELQLNPLWPVYSATRDQVLAFAEGAPVGAAHIGLLGGDATAAAPDAPTPTQAAPDAGAPPQTTPADDSAPAADAAADDSTASDGDRATPAPMASDGAQSATYVLQSGDNLTRIAAQYGTTVDAILVANGVSDPNRIYAGQSIVIPTAADGVADDAASASASANADTAQADSSASATAQTNSQAQDQDTTDTDVTYTVQPGDSAFKIARRFNIDQQALLDANRISNANRVYVGQLLTIPGSSS